MINDMSLGQNGIGWQCQWERLALNWWDLGRPNFDTDREGIDIGICPKPAFLGDYPLAIRRIYGKSRCLASRSSWFIYEQTIFPLLYSKTREWFHAMNPY